MVRAGAQRPVCRLGAQNGRIPARDYVPLAMQSFMKAVFSLPFIFCSLTCLLQSAVICFFCAGVIFPAAGGLPLGGAL